MSLSLNEKLIAIGIHIHSKKRIRRSVNHFIDIESTLIEGIMEYSKDARMISLILSWINIHGKYVIVEKMMKLRTAQNRHLISLMAAFCYKRNLHKWKKLILKEPKPRYIYPKEITDSAVKVKGAIPWLKEINIIVPESSFRIRESDIFRPSELIKLNQQYRNRYIYGACWRADIITAIEWGCESPTEITQLIGCSYEPAHRIFNEFKLAVG